MSVWSAASMPTTMQFAPYYRRARMHTAGVDGGWGRNQKHYFREAFFTDLTDAPNDTPAPFFCTRVRSRER